MRVLTFNVNSIRARKEIVRDLFYYKSIDVACLQEIKTTEEEFPQIHPEYHCYIHGQKQYNGVATCVRSRIEVGQVQKGFPGEMGESRFIYTQIGKWHLINIYAPLGDKYGERFHYKIKFYRQLREFVSQNFNLHKDLVVLCGDLNIAHQAIDVWDPQKWEGKVVFLPEERIEFDKLLGLGFVDILRYSTNRQIFTFYDYRGGAVYKGEGLRLDYFLVSKPVVKLTKGIEVLLNVRKRKKPTPSDHVPLIVEFRNV
jgi:exodeoxyribonuclease-3